MIRTACTWFLIVLAASPFTAPFSTCDVSVLLSSHTTGGFTPAVPTREEIGTCAETDDAGSLSPVVGRVVLSRDAVLVSTDWPVPLTPDTRVASPHVPVDNDRTLDDWPVQSSVLRL
jgi:hypothetical protein